MWKMNRSKIEWKCPSCGHNEFDYEDESNTYDDGLLWIYYTCRNCRKSIMAKYLLLELYTEEKQMEG